MAYRIISKCPVCSSKLRVVKLKCSKCGTVIENEFELSRFEYLGEDQLRFLEIFVKCRGNIKDVEKELGISYPTVRAKLDEVISALGYVVVKKPVIESKEIIDMLEKGEISADQAVSMMKENNV
ncbi:MAG: DUF2089 domain-containing protein [Eubacteriales bacterium]|nr:DUF2089 domain-containing protein [Eubacteriales bacterium]